MQSIMDMLTRLRRVRSLQFDARSEAETGWNGVGIGTVIVTEPTTKVVVFEETGTWQPSEPDRKQAQFNNVFRWSTVGETLRLEHLRFGNDHPVLLFDLAPADEVTWQVVSPHHCRSDCYTATLHIEGNAIVVAWSISGPRKRESIRYSYW